MKWGFQARNTLLLGTKPLKMPRHSLVRPGSMGAIRATGADPERIAALASGAVDAVILSTLGMVQAKKSGFP